MSVVHAKRVTGRDGESDKRLNKRYVQTWQVLTSAPTDGAKLVREYMDAQVPMKSTWKQIGPDDVTVEDEDADAFLVERQVRQEDGENFQNWTVTDRYVGRGDPTLEPAKVNWSRVKYQDSVLKDENDDPVVNSAGDPFEGGMPRDRSRRVLTVTKNVLTYNPLDEDEFSDSTNLFPFLATRYPPGFAIGTCKLDDISAEAVWLEDDSDIHYWVRTAKIEIDRRGWKASFLDCGFHEIVTVAGVDQRKRITFKDGTPPSSPVPLNGAGEHLEVGALETYLEFLKYPPKDWGPLDLEY